MVAHGLGVSLVPSPVALSYRSDERLTFTRVGTRPNAPQAWITVRREDQSSLIGDLALDLVAASESMADPVGD